MTMKKIFIVVGIVVAIGIFIKKAFYDYYKAVIN